jgi:hypothetical protein
MSAPGKPPLQVKLICRYLDYGKSAIVKPMAYDIGDLPLKTLFGPVVRATETLACLDERLARSPVRDGFVERQNFADAAAALWLEGELVHLEYLVLHDAHMDVRTPTHELTRAHAVLRAPRQIFAQKPSWALSLHGNLALTGRGGATPAARQKPGEGVGTGASGDETDVRVISKTICWRKNLRRSMRSLARSSRILRGADVPARKQETSLRGGRSRKTA